MSFLKTREVFLLVLFAAAIIGCKGCTRSSDKNKNLPGRKPYYFGTADLNCLMKGNKKKGKRGVPARFNLEWSHRMIMYDGYVCEILNKGATYCTRGRPAVESCSWNFESTPAGYSTVPVACLRRCTKNYEKKYGGYAFVGNNCHDFANRMSEVLHNNYCPSWC